jgi:hypothetical protein
MTMVRIRGETQGEADQETESHEVNRQPVSQLTLLQQI